MTQDDSRMHILRMIEEGKITADEGLRLLNAIGNKEPAPRLEPASAESHGEAGPGRTKPPAADAQIRHWRNWWTIPMSLGVAILILGAWAMYSAIQSSGFGFWFMCAWVPFLIGVAVTAFAWASRTSRWVHIRVDTGEAEWPRRIAISLPIPIRLIAWAIRTFGGRLSVLERTSIDELITAIDETATPEAPIFIDVHEGEKGERVQVYIG